MNRIIQYLKQPFPNDYNKLKLIIITSVWVFFTLFVLEPFGYNYLTYDKFLITLGYMLVTTVCTSFVSYILPMLFPKFYIYENWTKGKFFLHCILLITFITIGNFLFDTYIAYCYMMNMAVPSHKIEAYAIRFMFYAIATISIGIFPLSMIYFLNKNKYLEMNLQEVSELNRALEERLQKTDTPGEVITLSGNTKDTLALHAKDFLYLEASGNYVNIYYRQDHETGQKMLRTTILQMEKDLRNNSNIIRCHRAFIVNMNHIVAISANPSGGYQLVIGGVKREVPVSRSYTKMFRERLNNTQPLVTFS